MYTTKQVTLIVALFTLISSAGTTFLIGEALLKSCAENNDSDTVLMRGKVGCYLIPDG